MFDKIKKNDELPIIQPRANIYEQDDSIVLALEMPGADKDSLDVNMDGDILSVSGKKKADCSDKGYQVLYQERQSVQYRRDFVLNADIDPEKLKAEYTNGILKVMLGKAEKVKPKKIGIKVED